MKNKAKHLSNKSKMAAEEKNGFAVPGLFKKLKGKLTDFRKVATTIASKKAKKTTVISSEPANTLKGKKSQLTTNVTDFSTWQERLRQQAAKKGIFARSPRTIQLFQLAKSHNHKQRRKRLLGIIVILALMGTVGFATYNSLSKFVSWTTDTAAVVMETIDLDHWLAKVSGRVQETRTKQITESNSTENVETPKTVAKTENSKTKIQNSNKFKATKKSSVRHKPKYAAKQDGRIKAPKSKRKTTRN